MNAQLSLSRLSHWHRMEDQEIAENTRENIIAGIEWRWPDYSHIRDNWLEFCAEVRDCTPSEYAAMLERMGADEWYEIKGLTRAQMARGEWD